MIDDDWWRWRCPISASVSLSPCAPFRFLYLRLDMAYFLAQPQKLSTSLYDARKPWKPCKFFLKGHCRYGRDCKFLHGDAKPHKTCNYFLKGTCRNGPDCKFLHDSHGKLDQPDSGSIYIDGRRPNETAIPVPLYLRYVCGRGKMFYIVLITYRRSRSVQSNLFWYLYRQLNGCIQRLESIM